MELGDMLCVCVWGGGGRVGGCVCVWNSWCFNFEHFTRFHQVLYNLALKAASNSRRPALHTTSVWCWEKQAYKHDYAVRMHTYVCMHVYVCIYVCVPVNLLASLSILTKFDVNSMLLEATPVSFLSVSYNQ